MFVKVKPNASSLQGANGDVFNVCGEKSCHSAGGKIWKLLERRHVDEAVSFLPAAEHKQEFLCVTQQKLWETLQGMLEEHL